MPCKPNLLACFLQHIAGSTIAQPTDLLPYRSTYNMCWVSLLVVVHDPKHQDESVDNYFSC